MVAPAVVPPLPDDALLEQPAAASAATAAAASTGASPLLFKIGILSLTGLCRRLLLWQMAISIHSSAFRGVSCENSPDLGNGNGVEKFSANQLRCSDGRGAAPVHRCGLGKRS